MKKCFDFRLAVVAFFAAALAFVACQPKASETKKERKSVTAADILGNPNYQAISYGGYRTNSRDVQPTVAQLKEDMKILAAMDVKLLRTYNVHFAQAGNLLKAIKELKAEDSDFEMYVMLGAWINCKGGFGPNPDHNDEDAEENMAEINRAVALAKEYPDIVKVIAVGNEAMVKWAASYFVQPGVILKYVNHLQKLKADGELPSDLWITSSDNFASWGGGGEEYHVEDLTKLMKAVDFISLHTYPMHDTHYQPDFWGRLVEETDWSKEKQVAALTERSIAYSQKQYNAVVDYMKSVGVDKPCHIGETGWASFSNGHYGDEGSKATDQYKEGEYYKAMRTWTNKAGISCFYFEAFDEPWKDAGNTGGSENHFGLFTVDGKAKYGMWDWVDKGAFDGLTRGGNAITKTYDGNLEKLLEDVKLPEVKELK